MVTEDFIPMYLPANKNNMDQILREFLRLKSTAQICCVFGNTLNAFNHPE
jgi:hypothetical protein